MELVYVSDAPVPSDQANIVHMMSMCDAFQQLGVQTTLVLPQTDASKTPAWFASQYGVRSPVTFKFLKLGIHRFVRTPVFLIYALVVAIRTKGVTYTRCHLFAWLASAFGIPTIIELHAGFPATHPLRQSALIHACKHRQLKRIVVISDALRRDIEISLKRAGVTAPPQIVVEHDGAPLPRVPEWSCPWKRDSERIQIGYVGHLYPGRGIELLVKLAETFPEVDVNIVGGRPADLAYWQSQRKPPNLLLHGHVPYAVVPEYLSRFDIGIAPYARAIKLEGGKTDISPWISPLKLFDYMAYGLPIITSNIPTIAEVLTDGETALLCNPDRFEDWRRAVTTLVSDRTMRERLGRAAQALLLEKYTWTKRAERLLHGF